jgi:hypothetical protein
VLVGPESCCPRLNPSLGHISFKKRANKTRIMVAPQKKQAWKAESEEAALLFNLFQERAFHPDSYSAAGIYRNEDLNPIFGKFDSKNFGRYCQTQANRVNRHEKYGTGLSLNFKRLVKKVREKHLDLLKKLAPWQEFENSSDEEDDDYNSKEEKKENENNSSSESQSDNETLEEESLSDLVLDGTGRFEPSIGGGSTESLRERKNSVENAPRLQKNRHTPVKFPAPLLPPVPAPKRSAIQHTTPCAVQQSATTTTTRGECAPRATTSPTNVQSTFSIQAHWIEEQCTPTKSIVVHANSRIRVTWRLEYGWDGDIYISEDGRSIVQDTLYQEQDVLFDTARHFENDGIFDRNDIYFSLMSQERKLTYQHFQRKNPPPRPGQSYPPPRAVLIRETIFKFPFSVRRQFQDHFGIPQQGILIDSIGKLGDWAIGYLQRESPDDKDDATPVARRRQH